MRLRIPSTVMMYSDGKLNLHGKMHIFVLSCLNIKAQKHAHFHVFLNLVPFTLPPLHHNDKGNLNFE